MALLQQSMAAKLEKDLTKREWFAGQALAGMDVDKDGGTDAWMEMMAETCFRIADAMIAKSGNSSE